jgi:hypothetical protein
MALTPATSATAQPTASSVSYSQTYKSSNGNGVVKPVPPSVSASQWSSSMDDGRGSSDSHIVAYATPQRGDTGAITFSTFRTQKKIPWEQSSLSLTALLKMPTPPPLEFCNQIHHSLASKADPGSRRHPRTTHDRTSSQMALSSVRSCEAVWSRPQSHRSRWSVT